MGGGNALTTSLRPDLRSATVQSTNTTDDTTIVRVCFSKAIASLPQADKFFMGGYSENSALQGTAATRSSTNCADVTFPNDDATSFTEVSVAGSVGTAADGGISAVASNGFGNIQDATALIGSKSNNGTRGFATGPDLTGIVVNNGGSYIDYTFDQQIAGQTAFGETAGAFTYNVGTGAPVTPGIVSLSHAVQPRQLSADRKTLRVFFPALPAGNPNSISNSVRASALEGAIAAKSGGHLNQLRSVARPGNGGTTDAPDLVAVTVSGSRDSVNYQFDQALAAVGATGLFRVGYSSDTLGFAPGGVPTIVGGAGVGNTVNVPCALNCERFDEFLVSGSTGEGAVTGVTGGNNPSAGLPMGGNVGAFATGFTTGQEALRVTFDVATNVAHVLFDQRWTSDDKTKFLLIDDQGSQISAGAISVAGGGSPTPGQITADITFPPGSLAGARSLLIQDGAVTQSGAFSNITQVISPTAPASRKGKFSTAKRVTAAQRKALRRAAKRR
jgi:hypothetical protein